MREPINGMSSFSRFNLGADIIFKPSELLSYRDEAGVVDRLIVSLYGKPVVVVPDGLGILLLSALEPENKGEWAERPYAKVFESRGVTDESVRLCCAHAKRLINNLIDSYEY